MRTEISYNQFITNLLSKYELFAHQGFESMIFSQKTFLIKVYKYFIIDKLTLIEEKTLLKKIQKLLKLYAQQLKVNIISFDKNGNFCSKNAVTFGYALMIEQGIPCLPILKNISLHTEKKLMFANIGNTLASYHGKSKKINGICASFTATKKLLVDAINKLNLIISENKQQLLLNAHAIIHSPTTMRIFKDAYRTKSPDIHGDVSLQNIVFTHDKVIQFIDPGISLALGAGLENHANLKFDVGWDIVCFSLDLQRTNYTQYIETFIKSYIDKSTEQQFILKSLNFWYLLFLILSLIVCHKDLDGAEKFFEDLGICIHEYILYCYSEIYQLCGLENPYKKNAKLFSNSFIQVIEKLNNLI